METSKLFFYSSAVFLLTYGVLVIVFETARDMATFPITFPVIVLPFLLTIYTFILTTLTEPGFLPSLASIKRAVEDPILFLKTKSKIDHLNKLYMDLCKPEEPELISDEYVLFLHDHPPSDKIFYACSTCSVFRPTSTTSHCRECNKCVTGFDHHCGFLGICVGGRNRKNFCALLVSVLIFCWASLGICLANCWSFVHSFPPNTRYVLTLIEWIFLSLFSAFVCFEIFFAPWLLGFVETLRIVVIVGILGLVTTVVVVSNEHLPVSSGVLGYLSIVYSVFMLINLFAQIKLLRDGETVKRMIRKQQSGAVSTRLLSSPLSRSVTTASVSFGSSLLPSRTTTNTSGAAVVVKRAPLPTVNEDLSSSEEIYSSEDEEGASEEKNPLVQAEEGLKQPESSLSTNIAPMTWTQIVKFIAQGFLPTSVPSVYFDNN